MEDFRIKVIDKFMDLTDETFSFQIESAIYNYVIGYMDRKKIKKDFFKEFYMNKAFQVYANLKKGSYVNNKTLPKMLEAGKLKADKVLSMPMKKMRPEKWNKYKEDLDILNKEISNFDNQVTTTDQFTCGKCKENKTYYTSVQLRSSDEPMTQFIVCINCGNNWREG